MVTYRIRSTLPHSAFLAKPGTVPGLSCASNALGTSTRGLGHVKSEWAALTEFGNLGKSSLHSDHSWIDMCPAKPPHFRNAGISVVTEALKQFVIFAAAATPEASLSLTVHSVVANYNEVHLWIKKENSWRRKQEVYSPSTKCPRRPMIIVSVKIS